MSDRDPKPNPEERPNLTPDRNVEAGVRDSFPASDPPATTASQGARAVSPERMTRDEPHIPPRDAVRVTQAFPDAEAAKLALETLVREVPIDRRCAEILPEGTGAVLAVTLAAAERPRVEAMLRQQAGERDAGR